MYFAVFYHFLILNQPTNKNIFYLVCQVNSINTTIMQASDKTNVTIKENPVFASLFKDIKDIIINKK